MTDDLNDETVVVTRTPPPAPTPPAPTPPAPPVETSETQLDDETVVVSRTPPPPLAEPDEAQSDAADDNSDETIVVSRTPPAPPVETSVAQPDDETIVVPRADATAIAIGDEPDDEDDATNLVPRSTPTPPTPTVDAPPPGPGIIPGARTAFVPGSSDELLKERYQIRNRLDESTVAPYRQAFVPPAPRHQPLPTAELNQQLAKANKRRGIRVVVAIAVATIVTAIIVGAILVVVFAG